MGRYTARFIGLGGYGNRAVFYVSNLQWINVKFIRRGIFKFNNELSILKIRIFAPFS